MEVPLVSRRCGRCCSPRWINDRSEVSRWQCVFANRAGGGEEDGGTVLAGEAEVVMVVAAIRRKKQRVVTIMRNASPQAPGASSLTMRMMRAAAGVATSCPRLHSAALRRTTPHRAAPRRTAQHYATLGYTGAAQLSHVTRHGPTRGVLNQFPFAPGRWSPGDRTCLLLPGTL